MQEEVFMLRSVSLPSTVPGRLYLHSMPGRYEPFERTVADIQLRGIAEVICLVSREEIEVKSPDYARALKSGGTPWRQVMFPIVDYGVPDDLQAYLRLVTQTAASLRSGTNVLAHCGAGIGRTGTLAACVLIALGVPLDEALATVHAAGSYAERPEQLDLIAWVAGNLAAPAHGDPQVG
jgi:protein-tyrosine phosphatase